MAVTAPDHTEPSRSKPTNHGDHSWLVWLGEFLADRQWLGLVEFSSEYVSGKLLTSTSKISQAPPASMLVARKARAANRATGVRIPVSKKMSGAPRDRTEPSMTLLAVPLANTTNQVVLLYGAEQTPEQQSSAAALVRWASTTPERVRIEPPVRRATDKMSSLAESVLVAAYEHREPEAVARAIVNCTKRLCGCVRVSLAIQQKPTTGQLNLISISDQSSIDIRKILPVQLQAAIHESFSAPEPVTTPVAQNTAERKQSVAAMTLFDEQGRHPALYIRYPTARDREYAIPVAATPALTQIGMVLERPNGQCFQDAQIKAIERALRPSLNFLSHQFDAAMPLPNLKLQQWLGSTRPESIRRHVYRYRIRFCVAMLLVASALIPVQHRVSAQAAIESRDLQVLIAPQDGFVSSSHVRAGDSVTRNQLLATLDTQDLKLAADKWRSESLKNAQALQQALATKDRVALGRLRADASRIQAEMALVERQIARSQLRAPFDGVVLSGDLNQQLGAAVTRGDTLFTVAASNEYRLVLELDEQDVGLVKAGQEAEIRLSALPNTTWQAAIDTVLPVARTTDETPVFRVPAVLSERSDLLLPGMEGVARLNVGTRSVAWVYTRSLREKMRLLMWRLGLLK